MPRPSFAGGPARQGSRSRPATGYGHVPCRPGASRVRELTCAHVEPESWRRIRAGAVGCCLPGNRGMHPGDPSTACRAGSGAPHSAHRWAASGARRFSGVDRSNEEYGAVLGGLQWSSVVPVYNEGDLRRYANTKLLIMNDLRASCSYRCHDWNAAKRRPVACDPVAGREALGTLGTLRADLRRTCGHRRGRYTPRRWFRPRCGWRPRDPLRQNGGLT